MTLQTLKTRQEVRAARALLKKRGLDVRTSFLHNVCHKVHLVRSARVGDLNKSWDVLKTVDFLEEHLPHQASILDLGAYASEILPILHRLGYSSLQGMDFDPRIAEMPYTDEIRYLEGNFLHSDLPDRSFDAITAISVIEHGFEPETLLREMGRLLKPGGFFIASIDYWPEKIDTTGIRLFGLDWCIFSAAEIRQWIHRAARFHLKPIGDLDLEAPTPTIRWGGQNYTFAWMALKKIS